MKTTNNIILPTDGRNEEIKMNEILEMNRRFDALNGAYNAKIGEIQQEINIMDKAMMHGGDNIFESPAYAVLCAMQEGLIAARDKETQKHLAVIQEMSPEWDGD